MTDTDGLAFVPDKNWIMLRFSFDDHHPPPYICQRNLMQSIEETFGRVNRVYVAQENDGRCAGFVWVSFVYDESKRLAIGKSISISGHKARFDSV